MADNTHVTSPVTSPTSTPDTSPDLGPVTSLTDRTAAQRATLRLRHSQKLIALMETRSDLRGVHALADFVDDSVRWSA